MIRRSNSIRIDYNLKIIRRIPKKIIFFPIKNLDITGMRRPNKLISKISAIVRDTAKTRVKMT